jgi:D-amino peptidase
MEGIGGAVTPMQISDTGMDYSRSRRIVTDEVLAAIKGAEEAGATEFVIADAHGNFQNLLIEDLPANTILVRGGPRPMSMMQGIEDGAFDGAMFIGYHAGASHMRGVRAHTISSARVSEVKLNGVPASEGHINAAIASHYGVPVILLTGDDAAVEELRPLLKDAEVAVVKKAIGFHSAATLPPARAQEMIRLASRSAVQRIAALRPAKSPRALTLDLTFHFYRPAEVLSWLPMVERIGARSVRYSAADAVAALKFLVVALEYSPSLEP